MGEISMMIWGGSTRKVFSVFAMLALVGVVGCGGSTTTPQPVSGTVSIKGNGPLTKGTIRFTNAVAQVTASGVLDENGAFKLSSLAENDGAIPGEYTVTLGGTQMGRDYDHPNDPVIEIIDAKYENDSTTDLRFTVKPGSNVADFDVEPAKKE
jgi:hypothetical protein